MFKRIIKRDGKIVKFDPEKITDAIAKANERSRTKQRENLKCDAVVTRSLTESRGCSGGEMALQSCPDLRQSCWTFVCPYPCVIGCELLLGNWGEEVPFN